MLISICHCIALPMRGYAIGRLFNWVVVLLIFYRLRLQRYKLFCIYANEKTIRSIYSIVFSNISRIFCRRIFLSGRHSWYSATKVGERLRLRAYSTTSSSLSLHSKTPIPGFSLAFLTSRSSASKLCRPEKG